MNFLKRTVSVAVSALLIASSAAAVSSFSASAAEPQIVTDAIYRWTPIDRHYGWGEGPQEVEYSKNGYATVKEFLTEDENGNPTSYFKQQLQVSYRSMREEARKAFCDGVVEVTMGDHDGDLGCDYTLRSADNTNFTQIERNSKQCVWVFLQLGYYDESAITEDNPRGFLTDSALGFEKAKNWALVGETKQFLIPVGGVGSTVKDFLDMGYEIGLDELQLKVMNYDTNKIGGDAGDIPDSEIARDAVKYKGQRGLSNVVCDFSPIYIADGKSRFEAKDESIGLGFEFKQDDNGKNYFDFGEYGKFYQKTEDAQGDGYYGNGQDVDRNAPVIESTGMWGDANGDGKVTANDVLLIRKFAAGQSVSLDRNMSDVNQDGKITANDVLMIRKKIAGQNVSGWPSN